MKQFILALDQGTTSSRAIIFDHQGELVGSSQLEFRQSYPRPGWVEQDPEEIWQSQYRVAVEVLRKTGIQARQIAAIGITSQRETTLVWDRYTGKPVGNAIVWQCRRTAAICDELKRQGWSEPIKRKTGLIIDAYFSATKLKWILDRLPDGRARAARGELLFGTVDSWLIWKLTGGQVHATDYTNACRTMLYHIHKLEWDQEILDQLEIPAAMLPAVRPSSHIFGSTAPDLFEGIRIPIAGVAGDQQAALFGQACFTKGSAKNTYGTGCFILLNTGQRPVESKHGLLTTIAWGIGGKIEYALEGSIFMAGSAIQWLRDELRMIDRAEQSEEYAKAVDDTCGVYMVPAFTGLGAPHWDMYARGIIVGLTRGVGREHLVRATLEAIAFQGRDVIEAMQLDAGLRLAELKVDGGAAANHFLLQFQADLLGVPVRKPRILETTGFGAAGLAGLAVGYWRDQADLESRWRLETEFTRQISEARSQGLYDGWQQAVKRSMGWAWELAPEA